MSARLNRPRTHGHTCGGKTTPEWRTWIGMRQRCRDKNHVKYPRYGGRGIVVCDRWEDSFEAFLQDMGKRPPGTTLDRVDNDGPYSPENCRWATPKQQMENRTRDSFDNHSRNTHCPSGHPYSWLNVRHGKDGRKCRECDRLRAQRNRSMQRALRGAT